MKKYWERPYTDGVHGESMRDMIDIDEANMKLESHYHNFGKVMREKGCDAHRMFKKGAGSLSFLMGISGDEQSPFSFHEQYIEGGTDLLWFFQFMEDFIA